MAWPSDEIKMNTGQLYASTDGGETYHKVCELKEVITETDDSCVSDSTFQMLLYKLRKETLIKHIAKLTTEFIFGPTEGKEYDNCLDSLLYYMHLLDRVNKILPTDFKYVEKRTDYSKMYTEPWMICSDGYCKPECIVKTDASRMYRRGSSEKDIIKEKETKTMEARKCERCGKLYEVSNFAYRDGTLYTNSKNVSLVRFKFDELHPFNAADLTDEGIAKRQIDTIHIKRQKSDKVVTLCPDCLVSLKSWWEKPDKDSVDVMPCEGDKSNG